MALISLDFTGKKVRDLDEDRILNKFSLCSLIVSICPWYRVSALYYDRSYSYCKDLLLRRILELKIANDDRVSNIIVVL